MFGTILNVVSKVVGTLIPDKPKEVIRNLVGDTIKSDKQLMVEIREIELAIDNAKDQRKLIRTALRSEDPYVRRARPTFLWLMYVVILVNFIILPVLGKPLLDLPNALYYLFGTAFLGYGAARSWDKHNGGFGKLISSFQQKIK